MSQVKFFKNMDIPAPTNNAAEGLYFNQWGIGLSDGTITTDVSSVIKFNPYKGRFYKYTSTTGGKALFGTNGHNVHVQHNDYELIENHAYSNRCKFSPSIVSQQYDIAGRLTGLRRGLYVLTIFTKATDIISDAEWTAGYTSVSTLINIVFPNYESEPDGDGGIHSPRHPTIEDMYEGYPGGIKYDTGFPNQDVDENFYTSSGAWVFYSLPFMMFGTLCVARVELGTPANEHLTPSDITNGTVFPFGNYKQYAHGDPIFPTTPVTILEASNGAVISRDLDGYMFLDRFEVC